jgi:hypothetical protein
MQPVASRTHDLDPEHGGGWLVRYLAHITVLTVFALRSP